MANINRETQTDVVLIGGPDHLRELQITNINHAMNYVVNTATDFGPDVSECNLKPDTSIVKPMHYTYLRTEIVRNGKVIYRGQDVSEWDLLAMVVDAENRGKFL